MNILKYTFYPNETFLDLPKGAQFLSIQEQYGSIQAWFLVEPNMKTERRKFRVIVTGESFSMEHKKYLGTFQLNGGAFVGHLFEEENWS